MAIIMALWIGNGTLFNNFEKKKKKIMAGINF